MPAQCEVLLERLDTPKPQAGYTDADGWWQQGAVLRDNTIKRGILRELLAQRF